MTSIDRSQRSAARVAGLMLLLLMAAAFFSQIYVPGVVVADDAAATIRNIAAAEGLFRISIASDVLIFAGDVIMAAAFYILLRPVNPGLATLGLLWRTIQAAVMALNTLAFLGISTMVHASATPSPEAVRMLVDAHAAAFNLGLVFLGLGNGVFSYLLFRSRYVPSALGAWGVFANGVLASFSLALIAFPGAEQLTAVATGRFLPVFCFEVITGAFLLFRGLRPSGARPEPVAVPGQDSSHQGLE